MLKIENIQKAFDNNKVLNGLSLEVEDGIIYGLVGKNGAGKTTLFSIIAGLSDADEGNITLSEGCKVGFLPDVPSFFELLTASEYIDFLTKDMTRKKGKEYNSVLDTVGIKPDVKIKGMSRGMRQRLGIAAILVNNPEIIMLDEPTSALDPSGRNEVLSVLKKLKNEGKTVILSTNILNDMETICDKVGFLSDGVIKREVELKDFYSNDFVLRVSFEKEPEIPEDNKLYEVKMIEDNTYEFKIVSDNQLEAQKNIMEFLFKQNIIIRSIKDTSVDLDSIFQEVCQ